MQQTEPLTLNLDDIIVGDRLRKDYGDLSDLDTISERGLIQPIVVNRHEDGTHSLVAGGRRYAKLRELGHTCLYHGTTCDPSRPGFVYASELAPDVRREIELYENIGRKPMSWQERVMSIAEIHELKCRRAALDRDTWGFRESGAELGLEYSYVSRMVMIAEELRKPNSTIHQCENVTSAVRWFFDRRSDEAKAHLASMTIAERQNQQSSAQTPVVENNQTQEGQPPLVVPLSRMLYLGKMEEVLWSKDFEPRRFDNIITDWPYGIDMANLQQQNTGMDVSRVVEEHDVERNVQDFAKWLVAMFTVLKDGGHAVIWIDLQHWNLISTLAEQTGFRVQRWPLHWIKTSPCLNQMANKNFTKSVEHAIILSKGNAFLTKPQSTNYWSGPRAASTSNPFAKPKGLWHWIMSAICTKGETFLDPFAGEGSSILAGIEFGLRPTAIEFKENHFNQMIVNVRGKYDELTKGNVTYQ